MISSSFIHFIRTDSNAFFLIAEQYFIVYVYHCFLIHSSVDGHPSCFHVLAIVNSAVMNIGVHVSLSILVSLVCMPSSGIAGSSVQFSSVAQSCPTLCNPMSCSVPDLPVQRQLLEPTQIHVHWVSDSIQPSHPLLSSSTLALNLSQHQGLFK